MSMEINGSYDRLGIDHFKRSEEEQSLGRIEKEKETAQKDADVSGKIPVLQDEYISSERSGAKPGGLYRLGKDDNGDQKVFFDDPQKADSKKAWSKDENEQLKVKPDSQKGSGEKCIGNTDKVDREIKKLKQERQQLEQQIKSASGDEKKVRELEKKLLQVENELGRKDNDTYRKQHSSFVSV